jgi:ATPase subunit of ABC transporter with duplicated ATPase domains
MRRTLCRLAQPPPIIRIANASVYRQYQPSRESGSDLLFRDLSFSLPSSSTPNQFWGVLGSSSLVRTAFLKLLHGQYQCIPPTSRSYPYLSTDAIARKDPKLRSPIHAIQYVGFDADRGNRSIRGAYISARYESRREASDFRLCDFLLGNTELNAAEELKHHPKEAAFDRVVSDLKLERLLTMPVSNLSNGQTRRAKIAKALLASPEVLLLDGPFSECANESRLRATRH